MMGVEFLARREKRETKQEMKEFVVVFSLVTVTLLGFLFFLSSQQTPTSQQNGEKQELEQGK